MTKRAFILAIETYVELDEGLSPELPGTHASALEFREWLIREKSLDPADIFFCTEDSTLEERTSGASRDEVADALRQLKNAGKDDTEELFFLFSGHAFSYTDTDGRRVADVLIAADYTNREEGGRFCLQLGQIQEYLYMCMGGPADHYYFIDGCRNNITTAEIKVLDLGLTFDRSFLESPTRYTLYSTLPGYMAAVGSGFASHLIEGLKGAGKAKAWRGPNMAVLFNSLTEYVKRQLSEQPPDGRVDGIGEGMILEIAPPPEFSCEVTVQNAQPGDLFHVEVVNPRGQIIHRFEFSGSTATFSQVPDDYYLILKHPTSRVEPINQAADLYENCNLQFTKEPDSDDSPQTSQQSQQQSAQETPVAGESILRGSRWPPLANVRILGPPHTTSVIRSAELGEEEHGGEDFSKDLPAGRYIVETSEPSGITVRRREVSFGAGENFTANMTFTEGSSLRDSLLDAIPGNHYMGAVDFSESIGPMSEQDLGVWLALIGASRITGHEADPYEKLESLPLRNFFDEAPGAAPIYVLAGFDSPLASFEVGISEDDSPDWRVPETVAGIPGLYETTFPTEPGQYLLSMRLNRGAPLTLAVGCLANRATLVAITRSEEEIAVQQFILPIRRLEEFLPYEVRQHMGLRSIKVIAQATRLFAKKQPLSPTFERELYAVLDGKWLNNPLMTIMSSYELIRRGRVDRLGTAVRNLRTFFSDIPDTDVLANLAGTERDGEWPSRPPLFLEGLLAAPNYQELSPLDADRLDFRGPWTAWRSAVRTPE